MGMSMNKFSRHTGKAALLHWLWVSSVPIWPAQHTSLWSCYICIHLTLGLQMHGDVPMPRCRTGPSQKVCSIKLHYFCMVQQLNWEQIIIGVFSSEWWTLVNLQLQVNSRMWFIIVYPRDLKLNNWTFVLKSIKVFSPRHYRNFFFWRTMEEGFFTLSMKPRCTLKIFKKNRYKD